MYQCYLFDRNTTKRQEFDGRRTINENLKFDEIRFDKVFQDENCAAEGSWCNRVHQFGPNLYRFYFKS